MNTMIAIDSSFRIYTIYEHTMIILATESLIMGITLLMLGLSLKNDGIRSKSGFIFLSIAMFVLSIVNFVEYALGNGEREHYSLAIVIFAASVEMFLLFFAYMSMLRPHFITKRRIYAELGLIAIFTVPALIISLEDNPFLFNILFSVGVGFYALKLVFNLQLYIRQIRETEAKVEDYHSDDSGKLLGWLNGTFYMVLVIGVTSLVVPLTGFAVLTLYNIFVFFAYLFIYLSIISNISVFDRNMSVVEEGEEEVTEIMEVNTPQGGLYQQKASHTFGGSRRKFLDEWIASKGYSVAGITATEVAAQLNINRTKLSQYLKNELHTSYYTWIAELRIEDAKKQLIAYPERPISEISLNVGIEDRDNFRRVFQRITGMSPSAYRKAHLEGDVL